MDLIAVRLNTSQENLNSSTIHILQSNESVPNSKESVIKTDGKQDNLSVQENLVAICSGQPEIDSKPCSAAEIAELYVQGGQSALSNIGGHFSVVVLDLKTKNIFAITDKMATNNLFYCQVGETLIVSSKLSELKALCPNELTLSQQSIYNFIYFHCIPSPKTIYQEVSKLEPAQILKFDGRALKVEKVWLPNFVDNKAKVDVDKSMQRLQQSLSDATVRYADNPKVGAFLSGGLDSSSVVAFLAKNSSLPVNTFTIGFSEPGYDEKEFAQAVADKFGTNHTSYDVTPADIFEYLPQIAAYYDEPFGNSSALPTFFCAKVAKEHGIDIMLAGDGGDELFAGNARYANQKVFEKYLEAPDFVRTLMDKVVPFTAKVAPLSLLKKADSYIFQANMGLPDRLQYYNFLHQNAPESVFTESFLAPIDQQQPIDQLRACYRDLTDTHPVDNMLYLDWKFTLADNDLMKVNYMTEFAGISVVYPMLSEKMIALSTDLPADIKLPGQELRAFYKQALADVLPDSTLNKSKQGFGLPFGKWLVKDESLKELANTTLEQLKRRNIIRPEFIDKAMEMHQNVHAHYYGELVWIMIMLELWLQTH